MWKRVESRRRGEKGRGGKGGLETNGIEDMAWVHGTIYLSKFLSIYLSI